MERSRQFELVEDWVVVVVVTGGGGVIVVVLLSLAAPLLLPYVVLEESTSLPLASIDLLLCEVLSVPSGGGTTGAAACGVVVVVLVEYVVCANAPPVMITNAAAPPRNRFLMLNPPDFAWRHLSRGPRHVLGRCEDRCKCRKNCTCAIASKVIERKRFFFEKKKQKTFDGFWPRAFAISRILKEQKFFAELFFKKATSSFILE
jgi:hypothetical protein